MERKGRNERPRFYKLLTCNTHVVLGGSRDINLTNGKCGLFIYIICSTYIITDLQCNVKSQRFDFPQWLY